VVTETVVACPTDDLLVAFAQRSLTPAESEDVASHLDSCESCRIAVRAGAIGSPQPTLEQLPIGRAATIRIGTKIGRYEVRRLLGVGGMGQVFAAYDTDLDREVALKVLRPELAGTAAVLAERLVRESRLTAKVAHPSVMTVYDVGRDGDTVFIAMELIRGETLGVHLARTQPNPRAIVGLFQRAAAGLAAAHAAGIVHRDFKPENVLVETAGERRVIVTDFGIARASDLDDATSDAAPHDVRLTATGLAIGTPAYMAPEQLDGKSVDQRADVFAFSVSLWEALTGERPFPGTTIDQIRTAMTKPAVPKRPLPKRLLRALQRGLEKTADARWPDLPSFTRELEAFRKPRRIALLAAIGVGVAGIGIASGSAFSSTPERPCSRALAQFTYDRAALDHALAADPIAHDKLMPLFDGLAASWRSMHVATCVAAREPAQAPNSAACLEARRIEFDGVVSDLIADGPKHAVAMAPLISWPQACTRPPPAAQFSRVPENAETRRKVTALRYRAFDAELARAGGDYKHTIEVEQQIVKDAHGVWPPLEAEALYLLGSTQSMGADSKAGFDNLHQAAALAEAAHHDYIAISSWTQLITSATFDQGDPKRGLEYATYAEGALARSAWPPQATALFEYAKGTALVEANRMKEAEASLRHCKELCEQYHLPYLPQAIQGLGYLYEQTGRFADAVTEYRIALSGLSKQGPDDSITRIAFDGRLSFNLMELGRTEEAVAVALEGRKLADATMGSDSEDRVEAQMAYAEALNSDGQHAKALIEIRDAEQKLAKLDGERNERYGNALEVDGAILLDLERYPEAEKVLVRACDVIAFHAGDNTTQEAQCRIAEVTALAGVGKVKEALALDEKVVAVLQGAYGDDHPSVVIALGERGELRTALGDRAGGLADLEEAVKRFDNHHDAPGRRAALSVALAEVLWSTDPQRAKQLLQDSLAVLSTIRSWADARAAAQELLATNGHPKRHHWIL
jgi:serine/threonine protein kinase/tetratricopeptide (TPR) repeat protein